MSHEPTEDFDKALRAQQIETGMACERAYATTVGGEAALVRERIDLLTPAKTLGDEIVREERRWGPARVAVLTRAEKRVIELEAEMAVLRRELATYKLLAGAA